MMVVDASVVVKWFVTETSSVAARRLLQRTQSFTTPDFIILETTNVLRRKYKRGEMTVAQYHQVAGSLHHYFDRLVPAAVLVQSAVELAVKLDHDVYDCSYLACAIQQSLRLITSDDVFAGKAVANGFSKHMVLL